MSLTPLLDAGPVIAAHALAALAALVLGALQLLLRKGSTFHRRTGYVWCALMMGVALSSFWINDLRLLGPFSPIRILSVIVLVNVPLAIRAAIKGDIGSHRRYMISLFALALVGAGAFTLLPGRVMHGVIFSQ